MERAELFDLAVNRSLSYVQKTGLDISDPQKLRQGLELWYLKTRFAYRISLDEIIEVLQTHPGHGKWRGGKHGSWQLHKS